MVLELYCLVVVVMIWNVFFVVLCEVECGMWV